MKEQTVNVEDEPVGVRVYKAPTPIAHAFALVPDPEHPGYYHAIHLKNAYAEDIEHLEFSGRSSYRTMGTNRIVNKILTLHREPGGWDK